MATRRRTDTIRLAPGLTMPREAVTETFAILANKGKGKSNTATVFVEQLYHQNLLTVVLDVKGDWWGLRSSSEGIGDGLRFVIFGGDKADVPLEHTAGKLMADLIVDRRIPCVLDLSHMSKTKARTFAADFAEQLYFRNRESLMLVIDEADVLIPQRVSAETARLLGAMEDIAKRGRGRGIGLTVITQRPQEIAKSVLELCETVILLGMTGTRSIKAVKEWIEVNADDENSTVIASLPKLEVGEAWVWSPAFLKTLQRVRIDLCTTFDSHKTPEPGAKQEDHIFFAQVDLAKLGEEIQATITSAKDNDPKALKQQLDWVRSENEVLKMKIDAHECDGTKPDPADALKVLEAVRALAVELGVVLLPWQEHLVEKVMNGERLEHSFRRASSGTTIFSKPTLPLGGTTTIVRRTPTAPPARTGGSGDSDVKLGKTERKILTVLVIHGERTMSQIAMQTGYSPKASTIGVALSKLRKLGYVEPTAPIRATQEGVDALGDYDPLPTGDALLAFWQRNFGKTENLVLDHLLDIYPESTNVPRTAEATGYSPTASTIGVAMSKLRKMEIAEGWSLNPVFAETIGR